MECVYVCECVYGSGHNKTGELSLIFILTWLAFLGLYWIT